MASIKQIAQDIGVSAATVSNALTGKGRVSKDLAGRIRARADELGYRPSSAARALKTGQSGIIGLVMPDLTNPLFPRIAQGLSIAAEARGLGILIADSRTGGARRPMARDRPGRGSAAGGRRLRGADRTGSMRRSWQRLLGRNGRRIKCCLREAGRFRGNPGRAPCPTGLCPDFRRAATATCYCMNIFLPRPDSPLLA
ncbi:LacI family DNA-binding transcriptional regulator [Mangrovicoccus ximenensis]|uniref:LacI family DNA-binding transcriptional regulator n=1 Tax=Mangrovicoccus ximenensis TaxID=1911570 RepID=UPI000D3BDDCD|nr:LacI family DNA-binding transcriptional regulator [Mangrovicoccus ximenensis]